MMKRMIMSGWLASLLLSISVHAAGADSSRNPPNWGQRKSVSWGILTQDFKNPDMIYAPFIFWFWDEPLNPEKMAEMSRVMCSEGFCPGYAHARNSMVGTPDLPDEEWLGDTWFDAFGRALKEAEQNNSYLGYCDEYWWPSFQAHGRVLKQYPELKAESLNWQVIKVTGGTEVQVPASFFAVAAQVDSPSGKKLPRQPLYGMWIWHPDAQPTTHTCWFRKVFDIPQGKAVAAAKINITADNAFVLYVNGKRVGEGTVWMNASSFDLSEVLLTGKNVLAVEAKNIDGPFGLIAGMTAEFDDGTALEIQSDKTWRTSLSPADGFERPGYDASQWTAANEIGAAGASPWNSINNSEQPATIFSKTAQIIGSGQAFTWKAPQSGTWQIYVFNKYHAPGIDGGAVNTIDDRLGDAFIEVALEPYARRLGNKLGKSIPGDFIDNEGDYGRGLAWSDALDRQFKQRYGRDIRSVMPLMINKDAEGIYARVRWQWFDIVSDLYADNFRAITDWHEKRGMYTTAHVWEEGLPPQINAVGDHMKIQRALTMPGQDCLGRKPLRVHDFKEIESVAEFGNVRAATELMGAGAFEGKPWGTFNPIFLKQAVNSITAWGMSHVIPHGVFTTRKLTGNPWPPDWYSDNPMYSYLDCWTDFTRRASYINSMGCAVPDVLVYNPMESAWMNAEAAVLDAEMWSMPGNNAGGRRINAIDKVYAAAINELTDARVEFLIGDRYYLKQMEVKNGLLVRGEFTFRKLVLPPLDILTLEAARKMVDFAKSGGHVYALGELPAASAENGMNDPAMKLLMDTLKAQPVFSACPDGIQSAIAMGASGLESPVQFVSGRFTMLQHRRRINGRAFFWLANNTEQQQDSEVLIHGEKGAASIWDCENGRIRPLSSIDAADGSRLTLRFKPLEAYWLVLDPAQAAKVVPAESEKKDVLAVTGPWKVIFDPKVQPTMEFPTTPPDEFAAGVEKPLEDWKRWTSEKFSGLMDYTKSIHVDKVDKMMFLDLGKVCHAAEVWVNGKPAGVRLWGPYLYDISSALHPGTNEIRIRVANLINNSYGDSEESGLIGPVVVQTAN
ncbi:MAG: hypothetical protein JXB18_08160 [Sedimentisphaerales bacterium]|nr:hypothetical protein [Sedimentisphaerales bacterium]